MVEEDANTVHQVIIRKSHPALYRSIMAVGVMGVLLGFNFWFYVPTFTPYGLSNVLIGCIFFLLGTSQLVFLNVFHRLTYVRSTLAVSIFFMLFWGLSNTQQVFAGNASFQLPILYLILAALQAPWLIESPINPMTEKR